MQIEPQTTPEPTKAWFDNYFAQRPDDDIETAIAAFDREQGAGDDRTAVGRAADAAVPTALRVGGAILGGVAGVPGGPAGIIAGGAIGSGAGELAAEGYESMRGLRTKLNPAQIATQTALGAIPIGGKAASIGRNVVRRAVQGGVMGGSSTALTEAAEGQTPTAASVLRGAGLGTALGAAGGRLESAIAPRTPSVSATLPRLDALDAARRASTKPSLVERVKELPRKANRTLVDQFADVREFVAKGEKAGQLSIRPEHDPRNIVDLAYGGTAGRVENAFRDFRAISEDAETAGLGKALRQYLDLKGLSRGASTLDEHVTDAMNHGDVNAAVETFMRLHAGEALPSGYTPQTLSQDLATFRRQLGPRFAEVEQLGQRVFGLNRKALDLVHDAGIVGDDVYAKLTARGDDYVPLNRILDEVLDSQTQARAVNLSLKQQRVLFQLEGSKRATQDPIQASMARMQEAIREAGRNEAAQSLVALRDVHPAFAKQIVELRPGAKAPQGFGTLGVFESGQKRLFAVPEEVASAMNLADANEVRLVGSTMLAFSRNLLQRMATGANLAFSIPNVIRDIADARKLSTAYKPYRPDDVARFVGEWASALKSRMAGDPAYRKFLDVRAGYSTLQKTIDPEQFLNPGTSLNPLNVMAEINSTLEETTKLATFKRLKGHGKSDVVAAIETRRFGGSPDFARRGTASPELNLLVMFFNASVQGVARTLTRLNPIKNPGRVATLLGGATMSAMALERWNSRFVDPDGTPAVDRISENDRRNNFVFIRPETYRTSDGVERHRYFKLPKSHAARLIFNPIEQVLRPGATDTSDVALETVANLSPINFNPKEGELLASAGKGVVSSLNPILRAPLEQVMGDGGTDTFRDVPIVPRRLRDVEPNEQFTSATSPSIVKGTRAVNRALGTELSPMRVESFLRTGPLVGPGEAALSEMDDLVEPQEPRALTGDEAAANLPVLGPIARRFVGSPVDQVERTTLDRFYTLLDDAVEARRTWGELARRNASEAQQWAADPDKSVLLALAPSVQRIADRFSELRQARQLDRDGANAPQLGAAEQALLRQVRDVVAKVAGLRQPSKTLTRRAIDALYERYLGQINSSKRPGD